MEAEWPTDTDNADVPSEMRVAGIVAVAPLLPEIVPWLPPSTEKADVNDAVKEFLAKLRRLAFCPLHWKCDNTSARFLLSFIQEICAVVSALVSAARCRGTEKPIAVKAKYVRIVPSDATESDTQDLQSKRENVPDDSSFETLYSGFLLQWLVAVQGADE